MLEENSSYDGLTTLELLHNQSHDSSLPVNHENMHLELGRADTQWQVSAFRCDRHLLNSKEMNLSNLSIASEDIHALAMFSVIRGWLILKIM